MNFISQICTTKDQSERLLSLGLKKVTADMKYPCTTEYCSGVLTECLSSLPMIINTEDDEVTEYDLPAWSLHRLLSMLTYQVIYNGTKYEPVIALDGMAYQDVCSDDPIVGWSGDLYIDVIDCIKWLISIEQFNTEYLEKLCCKY